MLNKRLLGKGQPAATVHIRVQSALVLAHSTKFLACTREGPTVPCGLLARGYGILPTV